MIIESQLINYHKVRNLFMNQNSSVTLVTTWMTDRVGYLPLGLLSLWLLEMIWRR